MPPISNTTTPLYFLPPIYQKIFPLDSITTTRYYKAMNPLLQVRLQLGLTQQEVATRTGTTQQYIQRIESGMTNSCPPLIATFYATFLPSRNLAQEYAEHVHSSRKELPDLSNFFTDLKRKAALGNKVYLSGAYMFDQLCFILDVDKDEATVARLLHVHPTIINRWRATGGTPPTLVTAFKDTK